MLNSKGIEKAFRVTLVFFVAFLLVCFIADRKVNAATPKKGFKHYYSQVLKVETVDWNSKTKTGRVIFRTSNNYLYFMAVEDGDIEPGEFYTAIMYDNKTAPIWDDKIISIKYCRIDLF